MNDQKTVKVSKTIRQRIEVRPHFSKWYEATRKLYNEVVSFYFAVYQSHPVLLTLGAKDALTEAERLTHFTKQNPNPILPLADAIVADIPAMFRRAAINQARGAFQSFNANLERWRNEKTAFEAKMAAKGKDATFDKRPPVPPRRFNFNPSLYSGMSKDRTDTDIMVKLWSGTSWQWVKLGLQTHLCDGWGFGSPIVAFRRGKFYLHTPVVKQIVRPLKLADQVEQNDALRICSVDLNLDGPAAVCTILTRDGTPLRTLFVPKNEQADGRRKRLLGMVATKRKQTGVIAEDEQDNARTWQRIRDIDENEAHRISRLIVNFAVANSATVLVFEHLQNLRPERGKYSVRTNRKRNYWIKGKIVDYAKYKAWHAGIITSRVNPKDTSRLCPCCKCEVIRYAEGQPVEGYTPGTPLFYCPFCFTRGNADRAAAINIGHKFFARYTEKPQSVVNPDLSLDVDFYASPKGDGVASAQAGESNGPTLPSVFVPKLRPVGSGYATSTDRSAYG